MGYGDLIKDAFWLTLRNRYLWFFGFFAGGSLGSFNAPSGGGNFDDGGSGSSGAFLPPFAQAPFESVALLVGLVLLGLLLALAFVVLVIISQGGLAESVAAVDRGEARRFSSTWRAGVSRFWRVLGYYIVFFLIGVALLVAVVLPLGLLVAGVFFATESVAARVVAAVVAGLGGVLLLIALFIPLAIIGQFALREIALRGAGVFGSVGGGYRVFRRNVGRSILVWLIQIGLMIAAGIALILAALVVGLVLFLPTILFAFAEYTTAAIIAGVVAGLILVPLLIVASAILGTFNHSYWTLAYLRLTNPTAEAQPAPQV
jgi:hypothetical protein